MTVITKCAYQLNATVLDSDEIYRIVTTDENGDHTPEVQNELDLLDEAGWHDVSAWTKELFKEHCPVVFSELEKLGVAIQNTVVITSRDLENPEKDFF